jgi:hypothetical protein
MNVMSGNGTSSHFTEDYRVGVAGMTALVHLWNADIIEASFYLRLGTALGPGPEGLGERLNDAATTFLACKVDSQVQLLHLNAISYIEIAGLTAEAELREQVGGLRQPARIVMRTGETLAGEFLSIQPPYRSRISDLLNVPGERFILFLSGEKTCWLNRNAIARVSS